MDDGAEPLLGFDTVFVVVVVVIAVVAVLIVGLVLAGSVSGVRRWRRNTASPALTRAVTVVGRRTLVSGGAGESAASTSYFATFEDERRRRVELQVRGTEYGRLRDGDRGILTSQGTRYQGFSPDGS